MATQKKPAVKKSKKTSKKAAVRMPTYPKTNDIAVVRPLPNAFKLTASAARLVWSYWRQFAIITVIYGLMLIVLVQGLSNGTDVTGLKSTRSAIFTGNFGSLASGVTIFVVMLGSVGTNATGNGSYQFFVAIIISLVLIWALRQAKSGSQFSVRDAFYKSMYPLIPFILVLLVICAQLLPLIIGSALYSAAVGGAAVTLIEKLIFLVIYTGLAVWSGYMVSSSIFALYIVALPDMSPLQALRSARELVKGRRWSVIRKILFAPLFLLVASAIIMLPVIVILTPLARWIFFALTTSVMLALHSYFYTLYRELINDQN